MSRHSFMALWPGAILLTLILSLLQQTYAGRPALNSLIAKRQINTKQHLPDNRRPSLYTKDFGDCLGNSSINITQFDAAYYKDNMTVVFHLEGHTSLHNESLMMYIGVFAYGESRYELTFDPCHANMYSLCPTNSSIPIKASGYIPMTSADVSTITSIAFHIPDFEGQAILRLFSNSTESLAACYASVVTNGVTLAHPHAVSTILAIFLLVGLVLSSALAVYGEDTKYIRHHYAHSPSIFLAFSIFHHIYFTGVLSVNWPSVLVAFWSNFAWFAGMIYSEKMQKSIDRVVGDNRGNIRILGAQPTGVPSHYLGGGYNISKIYKRHLPSGKPPLVDSVTLWKRMSEQDHNITGSSTEGLAKWHGTLEKPDLPLPGNYSGFAGTLAIEDIAASNVFATGLLWFLILVTTLVVVVAGIKLILEVMIRLKIGRNRRFEYLRVHWITFTAAVVLRASFIGFFMMMVLSMFQFSFGGSSSIKALAAVIFILFFTGMVGTVGYGLFYGRRSFKFMPEREDIIFKRKKLFNAIPWFRLNRASSAGREDVSISDLPSFPWWGVHRRDPDLDQPSIHEDEKFLLRFGWLTARLKVDRWSFSAVWLLYDFIRACFLGGAIAKPMNQIFGLLAVEILFMICIATLKPFESRRLHVMTVYLLGFSKIVSIGLSAAFHPRFNLSRITTTVIGMVIVVIQGLLTSIWLISICAWFISSYISLTRHREISPDRQHAHKLRLKYLKYIDREISGRFPTPPPPPKVPDRPRTPSFGVSSVRRYPKIEDEDTISSAGIGSLTPTNSQSDFPRYRTPDPSPTYNGTDSIRSHRSYSNAFRDYSESEALSFNEQGQQSSADALVPKPGSATETPDRSPGRNPPSFPRSKVGNRSSSNAANSSPLRHESTITAIENPKNKGEETQLEK